MAVGPIPYTTLLDYCDRKGIEGEQAEDFVWLLLRLDQKYQLWSAKRNDKPSGIQPADHGLGRKARGPG